MICASITRSLTHMLRRSYLHEGPVPVHELRDLTDEETTSYGIGAYVKAEDFKDEGSDLPSIRLWTQEMLEGGGCGKITTTSDILDAQALPRNVHGYIYCTHCGEHFPADEFVLVDDDCGDDADYMDPLEG